MTCVGWSVSATTLAQPDLYSFAGREHVVSFEHEVESDLSVERLKALTEAERDHYHKQVLLPLFKFLYGPSTHRLIGGPQRDELIEPEWEEAHVRDGRTLLPIRYRGVWLLKKGLAAQGAFEMPVPLNKKKLYSEQWKRCTDRDPEHHTDGYYWYFWDPARHGCDHEEGTHFSQVNMRIGPGTLNEPQSFPEYQRLIRTVDGQQVLAMTFAFGYVKDRDNPRPDSDWDAGAAEYREFLTLVRKALPSLVEENIQLAEYKEAFLTDRVIGRRFTGELHGVKVKLNVVVAAGVDQMHLFAKSFAHDHDGVFSWMGHSRVGAGFDAELFRITMEADPDYYSVTDQYQIVYWGGCNSYSYYTLPFFDLKQSEEDPKGTKGLDIISHALPSYFFLGAGNSMILLKALIDWPERTSYQEIVQKLEVTSEASGVTLLAAVLGDEDNDEAD